MKRSLILLTMAVLVPVGNAAGQHPDTTKQISQVEPFRIETGVSFAASAPNPPAAGPSSRQRSIPDDVAEAIAVIRRSYVQSGRSTTPQLVHGAIDGMLQTLDPHSGYFDAAEYSDLLDEENSEYYGIGATIANFVKDGRTETYVLAVSPGSPAARAGLVFGDRIEEVNGVDVSESASDVVRDKVRGPAGSQVKLLVEKAATGKLERVTLVRGRVPYLTVPDAYMVRPGAGYIDLTEGFNFTTAAEFGRALSELHKKGMQSLVVDLRGNPGGVLDQSVKIAEKFLPAGDVIVTQKGRSRVDNRVWRSENAAPEKVPLVLLVDGDSASASEVLAGALQDHDRALIVGERTFGKGLVQSVMDLPGGAGLTLTTARYFTPSGRSIQRDYSDGSLYAYYNHRAALGPAAQKEAETDSKRRVYGGDGITPDETVKAPEYSSRQAGLVDAIFFFARATVTGKFGLDASTGRTVSDSASAEASRIAARFSDYLAREHGWNVAPETATAESTFIASRLAYYLTLARSGNAAARRTELGDDPVLAKAIEALPRAAELAKAAKRTQRAATIK